MKYKNGTAERRRDYISLFVFSLVLFLLSSGVLPFIAQEKNAPVPNLLLCAVCASSAFLTRKEAGIFAVICGFFADLFLYLPTSFSPVVYLLASQITPFLLDKVTRRGFVTNAVCSLGAIVVSRALEVAVALFAFANADFTALFTKLFLPSVAMDFAFSIVICMFFPLVVRQKGKKVHIHFNG